VCWPRRPRRSTVRELSIKSPRGRSPYTAKPIGLWWSTPAARINAGSSTWSVSSRRHTRRWRRLCARRPARQEYFCHADAEAAAEKLRALQSTYHWVDVAVQERPKYGPGRPSSTQPRVVKALRYGLQVTLHERAEVIARKTQEAGCFVLLTNVPTVGEMAHRAGDVLRAYKEQHGIEQNYGFLKDPLIVNSLFLKKPERIEALGLVLLLALLLWRLVERSLRVHVATTGKPLTGWDKKATQKPTAFMLMTKFAGVMVINVGGQRQLAHPLSTVQQQYLVALRVPATYFTAPQSG
jgi:hypothetical protein